MRAQYLINTERWTDPTASWSLEAPNAGVVARAIDAFASFYAAYKVGDQKLARAHYEEFLRRAKGNLIADGYSANAAVPDILNRQMRGLLHLAAGDSAAALALLLDAAKIEDGLPMEFGPPDVVKPSRELLGEVLLQLGRADDAQREFSRALELAPGRVRSLLGLGRAALAAGDKAVARRALEDLKRVWHSADASLPEVAELNRMLERVK
jgi:tetratricopeptide (TPR) repeat protein